MTVILPNVPYWQPALGQLGQFVTGLDDLAQAIRIILATPRGSLPHRPDFGCSFREILDMPQGLATARIIREVMESIARYEPRVQVTKVQVDSSIPGTSTVTVFWMPQGDPTAAPATTAVSFDASGNVDTSSVAYVPVSAVGTPGGVAPLDAKGTVPDEFLPKFAPAGGVVGDVPTSVDGGEIV